MSSERRKKPRADLARKGAETSFGDSASRIGHARPVDWPLVTGENFALPKTLPARVTGVSVLGILDELTSYRDPNEVLRRAVELARDRIGLERTAIFLYEEARERLCGTFGTGLFGDTTDESHIFFDEGFHHRQARARALAGEALWLTFEDVPLLVQAEGDTRVIGRGWNAITPILGRKKVLGLFCNDCARSGTPLDESKQVQLALLCRLLGGLLEDLRHGSIELPWKSLLSRLPRVGEGDRESLALSVVHELHRDPSITTGTLAKKFATNQTKLSSLFQEEMGMTIVEYRHRLRLERFFTLVDPNGGNLLQAALDAGFGSYAQFHRVFRDLLGTTPKEHLNGRESES